MASGKVRIIFRDYPLPQHPYARKAAVYADAAARIGRYERVCDTLFRTQDDWGQTGDVEGFRGQGPDGAGDGEAAKVLADPKSL